MSGFENVSIRDGIIEILDPTKPWSLCAPLPGGLKLGNSFRTPGVTHPQEPFIGEDGKPVTIGGVPVELDKVPAPTGETAFLKDREELSLLKFDGKDGPVYFVVSGLATQHESDAAMQSLASYGYEEHSCPTNWLRHVVAVIEDGEEDPHGIMAHMRTVQVRKDDDHDLRALFPEAFKP